MATLESDERNIVEADEVNWRMIVYPIVLVIVVLLGGFGYYYYQLNQREQEETQARTALVAAKTPADMMKVADGFPKTTQAAVALMNAADASFTTKDYPGALKAYQRVTSASDTPAELRDSAQLGVASVQEASGKAEDAVQSYLQVAHKGSASPFAPAAYYQVARIYDARKDIPAEKSVLQQAVQLGGDSVFVKQAAILLKSLQAAPTEGSASSPAATP
jgi:predicted negative regulator of RcsB-dependent stress response